MLDASLHLSVHVGASTGVTEEELQHSTERFCCLASQQCAVRGFDLRVERSHKTPVPTSDFVSCG